MVDVLPQITWTNESRYFKKNLVKASPTQPNVGSKKQERESSNYEEYKDKSSSGERGEGRGRGGGQGKIWKRIEEEIQEGIILKKNNVK